MGWHCANPPIFNNHLKYKSMKERKEKSVKLLTNEVLIKQLLKLYENTSRK